MDKALNRNNDHAGTRLSNLTPDHQSPSTINPLTEPLPIWYEFYKRMKLFPWWIRYNIGLAPEAVLRDKIINLGTTMGLQDKWLQRIIRHAVSEFSKKGLGADYYGYHNIDHELEAAYFVLMAANGQNDNSNNSGSGGGGEVVGVRYKVNKFSQEDIRYLFVAALFHDYDPLKQFDKPHEDAVEWFIRNDEKITEFIEDVGINIDIVIAIIHRTAYPYKGRIAEHAEKRMEELFTHAGIAEIDTKTRQHYKDLGWFLSVSERIAGYALGNFEHAMILARTNAHALGWHPSRIYEESVRYFSILKEERRMFEYVLQGIPYEYRKTFFDNIAAFKNIWAKEIDIRDSIRKSKITLIPVVEENENENDSRTHPLVHNTADSILKIFRELHVPVDINNEARFRKSLNWSDTILVTLRVKDAHKLDKKEEIVGYVKGGALENYHLRHGTHDENFGKENTAYMEWIGIKAGFWGENGGHILRFEFLKEAKRQGYSYVSSYVHRNVIELRINRGENIEIIQKYDPDKLDYYRYDLSYLTAPITTTPSFSTQVMSDSINSGNREETEMDRKYPIID
ncbi:MAG TPA: hypothetical protein VKA91_06355 [Nitrososphaeraceae archaeon]|nr:hypothetical protein [Nitrososphaeraceae archaeon]